MKAMQPSTSLRIAVQATLHCLTGCGIGEVLGSVTGSGLGWSNWWTEALTIPLAFTFGYALTMWALREHELNFRQMVAVALASDSLSIVTMEVVDTLIILLIPGALAAGPSRLLFWWSLGLALLAAFLVTVPVNRYLISRGKGHALAHHH